MNKNLEQALNYDPLYEAEKLTGESHHDSEATGFVGMLLAQSSARHKHKLLTEADDISMDSKLAEWMSLVERLGFELLTDEPIEETGDRLRIFWRNGVLLRMDSYYDDTSVNSSSAYFNFKGPRDALFRCSSEWSAEVDGVPVWGASFDAREAIRFTMERLEANGEILPQWIKQPFLWLLHYRDSKHEGYDYKAINAARIAQFPEHVRAAICQPEDAS